MKKDFRFYPRERLTKFLGTVEKKVEGEKKDKKWDKKTKILNHKKK